MAITVTCPSCGKRLSAPDSTSGKRAKCPKCSTIMVIPTSEARIVEPEPIVDIAPKHAGAADGLNDLGSDSKPYYDVELPSNASEAAAEPERRPCRACGEMIVATAAKCRFCGEIYDSTLTKISGTGKPELCVEARDALILAILGLFCFGFILQPWALVKAQKARARMAANRSLTGGGLATAATIIAIIGLGLMVLGFIAIVAGASPGP